VSEITVTGSALGNSLQDLLMCEAIEPGSEPSYAVCKTIYETHVLGAKLVDTPIDLAQSQPREISIRSGPEERLRQAFQDEWKELGADKVIKNVARLARIYGVASVGLLTEGTPSDRALELKGLPEAKMAFNVWDPLNTAGSLVLNQNPNALDFQKHRGVSVQGTAYHRSRTVTMLNEDPIYIGYTTSAFGYVGRSVYQRSLFPLKSFIQSMMTDDLITLKAGVLIAKVEKTGSIIDNAMIAMTGQKRGVVQEAQTGNVISITTDEEIESLNLQNLDGAYGMARKNLLDNIATAAGMPAKLLNSETFAEGFGEGTEDSKAVAQFIDRLRVWMDPLYDFFDRICMYRAWNPEFYKTIQADFPKEYGKVGYTKAFYDWKNAFVANWPNLLKEPDSELAKLDDVKLKAVIAAYEVLAPNLDPENKAKAAEWLCDQFNNLKLLVSAPLVLDFDAMAEYEPPTPEKAQEPPKPFSSSDSARRLDEAVSRLPDRRARARA
jgi:hypothetical protein